MDYFRDSDGRVIGYVLGYDNDGNPISMGPGDGEFSDPFDLGPCDPIDDEAEDARNEWPTLDDWDDWELAPVLDELNAEAMRQPAPPPYLNLN